MIQRFNLLIIIALVTSNFLFASLKETFTKRGQRNLKYLLMAEQPLIIDTETFN